MIHPDASRVLDQMDRWSEMLDEIARDFEQAVVDAAIAEAAYDDASSLAAVRLRDEKPADVREALVHQACKEQSLEAALAKARVDGLRKRFVSADKQVERYRSHNSAVNSSLRESGSSGRPAA